jgi:hypothetical protein
MVCFSAIPIAFVLAVAAVHANSNIAAIAIAIVLF